VSNNIETHADQLRIAADKADAGKFLDRVDAQAVRAAAEKVGRYQSQHAAMLDALRKAADRLAICCELQPDQKERDTIWAWVEEARNALPRGTP